MRYLAHRSDSHLRVFARFMLIMLMALYSVTGCGNEPEDIRECGPEEPCEGGLVCEEGACVPCAEDSLCAEGFWCDAGVCVAISCEDGTLNGTETDIDCGGDCPRCEDGKSCLVTEDCESGLCLAGTCVQPSCEDGTLNGTETDIDCGGDCPPCEDGESCLVTEDCESGLCLAGTCVQPSCEDGTLNGTETDIDCGGDCPPCEDGESCSLPSDCRSASCSAGTCMAATCNDEILNGSETDIDCGGACSPCMDGQNCRDGFDCASQACTNGVCVQDSCTPYVVDAGCSVGEWCLPDMEVHGIGSCVDSSPNGLPEGSSCQDYLGQCEDGALCIGGECRVLCDPEASGVSPGVCLAAEPAIKGCNAMKGEGAGGGQIDLAVGVCEDACVYNHSRGGAFDPLVPCADTTHVCQPKELFGRNFDVCRQYSNDAFPLSEFDVCPEGTEYEACRPGGLCLQMLQLGAVECYELCFEDVEPGLGAQDHPDCSRAEATCAEVFLTGAGFGVCYDD